MRIIQNKIGFFQKLPPQYIVLVPLQHRTAPFAQSHHRQRKWYNHPRFESAQASLILRYPLFVVSIPAFSRGETGGIRITANRNEDDINFNHGAMPVIIIQDDLEVVTFLSYCAKGSQPVNNHPILF